MITVVREPEIGAGSEHCCFCGHKTPYWHEGRDVAVCLDCATDYRENQLPDKKTWCKSPQARGVRGGPIPKPAQAIEARSDTTGTGVAVGESAVPKECAPTDTPKETHHD